MSADDCKTENWKPTKQTELLRRIEETVANLEKLQVEVVEQGMRQIQGLADTFQAHNKTQGKKSDG